MMSDIKAQAKSSRNTKLHVMGGKGSVGKSYDTGAGHTFNGEAGLNSDHIQDEQRIKTRKDGGRVGGTKMKPRLDRKAKMNDHDEDDGYNRGGRVKKDSGGSTGAAIKTREDSAYSATPEAEYGVGGRGDKTFQYNFDKRPPGDSGRTPKASGGKVSGKGKTNITIVMAPGGQGGSQAPQAIPVPRPIPVPIQAPPPAAGPPVGAGAPPMPMPPPGAAGPMGRKKGGRVNKDRGGSTGSGVGSDDEAESGVKGFNAEGSTASFARDGDSDNTPPNKPRSNTPRNRASGGKVTVGKGLGMKAGSGGGEGRLEKIKVQKRTYP